MVTVAVRRVNLTGPFSKESLLRLHLIAKKSLSFAQHGRGCYSADKEAIRTARLAREVGLSNWVKLEVIGDQQTLFPDTEQLIEATRVLRKKKALLVLPYTNDDLIAARKLIDAGAAAVMPLAAPIGSGLGIQNPANLRILRERITEVPMIVDAGVGTASDAAVAMELGADGVLMNTAIAEAADAVLMAEAMREAVSAAAVKPGSPGACPEATVRSPLPARSAGWSANLVFWVRWVLPRLGRRWFAHLSDLLLNIPRHRIHSLPHQRHHHLHRLGRDGRHLPQEFLPSGTRIKMLPDDRRRLW